MIALVVSVRVRADKLERFLAAITENAERTFTDEPGCRRFDVTVDENDPGHFFLFEVYDDEAAFQKHTTMDHFATVNSTIETWVLDKSFKMFRTVG